MMARVLPQLVHVLSLLTRRSNLIGAAGWVTVSFVFQQVLRLGTSIALARLLAPELLGTMVLINALRTGGELLTDVGVGQSIVKDPRGSEKYFYNTAWTIQILRGMLLFVMGVIAAIPLGALYDNSQLGILLPISATVFVITGFVSPAPYLLQKRQDVRKLAIFSTWTAVASSVIHIALALYTPTVWALVWGLLISAGISTIASYFLLQLPRPSLCFDVEARSSIIKFGKWIFASSLIYFAAMNFDRLYLASVVPLAVLGVYGIARTLADTINLLAQRLGALIVFPRVSASQLSPADLRRSIMPLRRLAVAALAFGLAGAVAFADLFILLTYDERYRAAAIFLPIMLIGTWFSVLASFADSLLMGMGKPANTALANGLKLIFVVALVPPVLSRYGMLVAVGVFAAAEALRYAVLVSRKRALGMSFVRQDVLASVFFVVAIILWREASAWLGLTGGIASWTIEVERLLG